MCVGMVLSKADGHRALVVIRGKIMANKLLPQCFLGKGFLSVHTTPIVLLDSRRLKIIQDPINAYVLVVAEFNCATACSLGGMGP